MDSAVGEAHLKLFCHSHYSLLCLRYNSDVRLIVMADVVDDLDPITDFEVCHGSLGHRDHSTR